MIEAPAAASNGGGKRIIMVAQLLARRFSAIDAQLRAAIVAAIVSISIAGLGGPQEART
jgi:hypothetical protein